MKRFVYWYKTDIPDLSYGYVFGFYVEKLVTRKGERFSIGKMKDALITFQDLKHVYQFLTA